MKTVTLLSQLSSKVHQMVAVPVTRNLTYLGILVITLGSLPGISLVVLDTLEEERDKSQRLETPFDMAL